MTVKAEDGHGGSATIAVTITVTDVAEQPETPAAPSVTATAGSTTSLDVAWTAPGRNGGPELTGYKLQYRKGGSGSWTEPSGTETGTSATIASLDANSEYQVQVRALNGETPSAWSPTGTGSTRENSAPTFANNMEPRSVAENTGAGESVGAVVAASDTDVGDTLTYSLEGTDAAEFDIVSTSGQIQTKSALDYETDPSYSVTVKAEDGHGGSATIAVTITVTDVGGAAGDAGGADGGGDGEHDHQPGRELDGAGAQRRPGADGLCAAVPQGRQRALEQLQPQRHGRQRDDRVAGRAQRVPGAGAGAERGDPQRLVAHRDGLDGEQPAGVRRHPAAGAQRGGEHGRGESVGAVVAASDDDTGDMLTYSLEGTDARSSTSWRPAGRSRPSRPSITRPIRATR